MKYATQNEFGALLRSDFGVFLEKTFETLNPSTPFAGNWHIEYLAYYAQQIIDRNCTRLIVNLPPRMLKSMVFSVFLPAFILGKQPKNQKWVIATFAEKVGAPELSPTIDRAHSLAKQIEDQIVLNDGTLKTIINRVEVCKSTISIRLDLNGIADTLLPNVEADSIAPGKNKAFHIVVSGQFLRCGKQVRLVLGNDGAVQREPDNRLILEILRAQTWFDDLASGRAKSIAELARLSRLNVAHVSRRITLAFLTPRIVESIITGAQPVSLTVERLGKACPLPVSWDEQSAQLLA